MSKLNDALRHGYKIQNTPIKFNKPALSLDDQIEKLKEKGMIFEENSKIKHKLGIINYYRLEAYWYPYYNPETEKFTKNISFDFILNYYRFDNEFRILIFKSITYIEIAFRTQFAYNLSIKYGAHALLDDTLFFDQENWNKNKDKAIDSYNKYEENFITHFREKYTEELPPIWAHVEFMSLGDLLNWWSLLQNKDKKEIINIFQLKTSLNNIRSWLNNLRAIRNYCAHHSRLWNRAFAVEIKQLKNDNISKYKSFWNNDKKKGRRIFNSLIILDHLLNSLDISDFNIIEETYLLTQNYKINDIMEMGFPSNFKIIN